VFAHRGDRDAIEHAAGAAGVPFVGLWLEAPEQVLVERSGRRRNDASDADPAVVREQLVQGAGAIGWHGIQASAAADDVARRAVGLIHRRLETPSLPACSRRERDDVEVGRA
jgi:predicted kinase